MIKTLAFRFALVYFLLYSIYSIDRTVLGWFGFVWDAMVNWAGANVFGIAGSAAFVPNGSGDQTGHWVQVFVFLVLAGLACVGWTAADRGRNPHPRLAAWLTVGARYWLGMVMVAYGILKVFPLQFPFPDEVRLTQAYGESSPMGLAWTFMGYSPLYRAFSGVAEVLGGALLFWRRTTSLGALICIGVLANIVVLNLGFDIPVKLFSSHLLVVAFVLAGQDAERLIGVLVLGRAVPAHEVPPVTTTVRGHRIRWVCKGVFLAGLTIMMALLVRSSRDMLAPAPLHGVYEVTRHELECTPSSECNDEGRWRQVVFGRWGQLAIDPVRGPRVLHWVDVDERELVVTPAEGGPVMILNYSEPTEGTLDLEGKFGGAEHRMTLQRVEPEFLLVDRGFRWISEAPFNR